MLSILRILLRGRQGLRSFMRGFVVNRDIESQFTALRDLKLSPIRDAHFKLLHNLQESTYEKQGVFDSACIHR